MIAPTATSLEPFSPPMIATIGISDSGSAVATAARNSDRALAEVHHAPEPLDCVREQECAREQDREARGQQDGRAHPRTHSSRVSFLVVSRGRVLADVGCAVTGRPS